MALSSKEQFNKLLQQINFTDPSLSNGELTQVTVHQKSRVWELYIHLDQVLPYPVFQQFYQAMVMAFNIWRKPMLKFTLRLRLPV